MFNRIKYWLVNAIASKSPQRIRNIIYRVVGFCSTSVSIRQHCYFQSVSTIYFGDNVFINKDCNFYNGYGNDKSLIEIGNNVSIGFRNTFITTSHNIGDSIQRADYRKYTENSIKIGDGVWITSNCTILPGVTIGKGCVISAGAVVVNNCEENGLYGGIPARRIRNL